MTSPRCMKIVLSRNRLTFNKKRKKKLYHAAKLLSTNKKWKNKKRQMEGFLIRLFFPSIFSSLFS